MIAAALPYIDIHCHRALVAGGIQLRSVDISEITADAALLSEPMPAGAKLSIGIHPWFIKAQNITESMQKIPALCSHQAVVAIGECGLDKCIDTGMAIQIQVFSGQIEAAERLQKPLIVHCVRAFNELLQLHKQYRPSQPWLVHGFSGKAELARQLTRHGLYLCFGQALLNPGAQAADALQAIPLERLFLETDDSASQISEIYAAAAKILGLELPALQRQLVANFERVFAHD